MNERDYRPITTDVRGIMAMLGVGRNKAREIGEAAGAVIHISTRRNLYLVDRIKTYMENYESNEQQ